MANAKWLLQLPRSMCLGFRKIGAHCRVENSGLWDNNGKMMEKEIKQR